MNVKIIEESGYSVAMLGLSLNKKQPVENMPAVALKLIKSKCPSHSKFLRQIKIALDITAPRYFWSEFDTYKIGTTAQSESTMHTIKTDVIDNTCFEEHVPGFISQYIREMQKKFNAGEVSVQKMKAVIPESWLQRRIVTMDYQTIKNIYSQRKNHGLDVWREFCASVKDQIQRPELLGWN